MTFNDAIVENDFGKYVSCYSPKIAAMFTSEDFALDRSYYIDKMGSQNFNIGIISSHAYTFDDVGVSDSNTASDRFYARVSLFDDVYYSRRMYAIRERRSTIMIIRKHISYIN